MKRYRIRVRGRVQGVYFRQSTSQVAASLGVTGWVMNLPSGEVLLEAQSNPGPLADLVDWLRTGPPLAEVSDIGLEEIALEEGETKFEVRYGG